MVFVTLFSNAECCGNNYSNSRWEVSAQFKLEMKIEDNNNISL
jgi:hypothetical protein